MCRLVLRKNQAMHWFQPCWGAAAAFPLCLVLPPPPAPQAHAPDCCSSTIGSSGSTVASSGPVYPYCSRCCSSATMPRLLLWYTDRQ